VPINSRPGRKSAGVFRVLLFSLIITVSVLSIQVLSQSAAALSVDIYGWNGYRGNSVIYMTSGLPDATKPNIISTAYNSSSQTKSQSPWQTGANALNMSAGQAQSTTDTPWMFNEYFVGGGTNNYLLVNIPIVAGGAGDRSYFPASCDPITHICSPAVDYRVGFQSLAVSPSGAPAGMNTQFNTGFNSGLNVSPSSVPSPNQLAQFAFDTGCTFFPYKYLGFVCWEVNLFMQHNNVSAAYESQAGTWGNSPAYVKFQTSGGSYQKNLFTSQTVVTVKIPESSFMSYAPVLNISATNLVAYWSNGNLGGVQPGAIAFIHVSSVPAVTLTGTVTLGTQKLAVQPITVQESYNGATTNYHLTTDSNGKYRFFARLGTSYQISTTYGIKTWQTSPFTTPSQPTAYAADLGIPPLSVSAVASPTSTSPGVSVQFAETLSGGYRYPITLSWTFGDGATGSGSNPTHVYGGSGTYTATVTVSDSSNPVQTSGSSVVITVSNPCSGSSACISPASQTVLWNYACFVPTASFAGFAPTGSPGPYGYAWNFGDGTTGAGQTISHTYGAGDSTYTVTLTITDSQGHTSTATATVTARYVRYC
jgi:chitodextrinase